MHVTMCSVASYTKLRCIVCITTMCSTQNYNLYYYKLQVKYVIIVLQIIATVLCYTTLHYITFPFLTPAIHAHKDSH